MHYKRENIFLFEYVQEARLYNTPYLAFINLFYLMSELPLLESYSFQWEITSGDGFSVFDFS